MTIQQCFPVLSGSIKTSSGHNRLVRLDGESLNQLLSTLADWNQCLTDLPPDVLDDLPNPGPTDCPEPSGP